MHTYRGIEFFFEKGMSPEMKQTIRDVNAGLSRARAEYLADLKITWDMPERLMLSILQARFDVKPGWSELFVAKGGPKGPRLGCYLDGVLVYGEARRVDPRIREVMLHIDQGWSLDALKRGPATYHPGKPPMHKVWRASREAKAATKAVAAAAREAYEADAA